MTQANMFPRLGKVGEDNRYGDHQVRYRCASERESVCTQPGVYISDPLTMTSCTY